MDILIWGAGNNAKNFLTHLSTKINVYGVVDSDCNKWGGVIAGYPVISIKDADLNKVDYIVICSLSYNEIQDTVCALNVAEEAVLIGVAEYYAECEDEKYTLLLELLKDEGKVWFHNRVNYLKKDRKYKLLKEEILKVIDDIEFDEKHYPISCYGYDCPLEIEFVGDIFNYVIQKYNLEISHTNCFGYKHILSPAYSMKYVLQFNFPSDCYPLEAFIHKYVKSIGCSLDVGANMGLVSCFLSRISQTVHAFEPSKAVTDIALRNLKLNNIDNVVWNICGCGEKDGEEGYYDYGITLSGRNSFIKQKSETEELETQAYYNVPVVSLDTYCREKKIDYIDLLKLDAEGYEPYIIRGCRKLLANRQIGMIILEISVLCIEDREDEKEMLIHLSDAGFDFYNLYFQKLTIEQILNIKCHEDIVGINRVKMLSGR